MDCKTYSLKLFLKSIEVKQLKKGSECFVDILKESEQRQLGPFVANNNGEIIINEKVEFKIPSGQLKRDSKCIIRVISSKQTLGNFEFLIMNYKNYSKSSFKITHNDSNVGTIHMSINIASTQANTKQEEKQLKPPSQRRKRKRSQEFMLESVTFQMPSINIKGPVVSVPAPATGEEIKLVCPSQAVSIKEPKSMFGVFQNSGIVINTKKTFQGSKPNDKKPLSSMGELFQKKTSAQESLKIPLNENLINSCKFSPNKTVKDSRYCKQIQQNLDNLSALDQQSNRLSYSRSPLKSQEAEFNIFNTLYRMKDKFQKIHEHEGILNDEESILGPLSEVNEEGDTQDRERLISSNHNEHCYELKSYMNSDNVPNYELGKSTILNLQVHSHCDKLQDSSRNYNRIVKTLDFRFLPTKPPLKITPCFNFKFILNNKLQLREDYSPPQTNKRYMIAKVNNVSEFFPEKEEEKYRANMTQSYLNFEIQEESLKRVSYIKLNKISHLSRAADISKRRNNFLIKANEQLKVSQRLAQQKLQISKKIISEKEDILNHQFQTLKEHMRIISSNLSLKNEESIKREEKIRSLQGLVEQYARDINCLKNQLKCSAGTIKDLKCLLSLKEETDLKHESSISIKEPKPTTRKDLNLRTQKCTPFLDDQQKRANSTSKTFMDRRIRKNSSIQNTFNNGTYFQEVDKSADFGRSNFRKFSHSKNTSFNVLESQQYSRNCNSNNSSKIDQVFDKLAGLFTGDAGNRLLKNL